MKLQGNGEKRRQICCSRSLAFALKYEINLVTKGVLIGYLFGIKLYSLYEFDILIKAIYNETRRRQRYGGDALIPRVAFENPEYSYTLPSYQTACGAFDIFNHVLDNYYLAGPMELLPADVEKIEHYLKLH